MKSLFDKVPPELRGAVRAEGIAEADVKAVRVVDDVEVTVTTLSGRKVRWAYVSPASGWRKYELAEGGSGR